MRRDRKSTNLALAVAVLALAALGILNAHVKTYAHDGPDMAPRPKAQIMMVCVPGKYLGLVPNWRPVAKRRDTVVVYKARCWGA